MFPRLSLLIHVALAIASTVHESPSISKRTLAAINTEDAPTVKLDKATVIGNITNNITSFYGLPFAQPPLVPLICCPFYLHR